MKTESDFNQHVTKMIRQLGTSVCAVKLSDRFKAGISDWIIFRAGMAVAAEAKFIRDLPGPKSKLILKHPISGAQITFLRKLFLCGVRGFIFLGIKPLGKILVVNHLEVPDCGNFTPEWLDGKLKNGPVFSFDDLEGVVDYIFRD